MDNLHKRKSQNYSSNDEEGGDGNQTSRARTSISNLPDGETYEVFLSFRGEETRKNFTDHLYERLVNVGVWVFRDDEALPVGEEIGPELEKAITCSKISIPIISPNYASSEWCLKELVHILECKKKAGRVVLPIFYRVDPSTIKHQSGTFEKAFHSHEKTYGSDSKVVQDWRNALAEVTSLKGLESSKIANGHEGRLVEEVVNRVLNLLRKATLDQPDCLVGIEDHVKKILEMIEDKGSNDAHVILIHGMGGIGKTTLAKVIYNQLSTRFKHCSFLSDIREKLTERNYRPEVLQKQLISDILQRQWKDEIPHVDGGIKIIRDRLKEKKVLILFDDVDNSKQLDALARDPSWFKSGSILIITTRNKDVMKKWDKRMLYELPGLNTPLSLQLFCKHAFRRDECPSEEFDSISESIISTTGGLPLAIEVIGSMLFQTSKVYWEGTFKKLKNILNSDVKKVLKISYDALEREQKQIFLDIACLPIQEQTDFAFYMWDDCGFYPEEGVEALICRSLIKIEENGQITIHDQLRDLGRQIVRQEACEVLGNQSRIWNEAEALEILQRKEGTTNIRALSLNLVEFSSQSCPLTIDQFKNLTRLRFLELRGSYLEGDFENFFSDLRWFQSITRGSIPPNFCPSKLVVLELSYSKITEHWKGWAQIQLVKKLKVLILEFCVHLTSTPDFSAFEKLEILNLRGCHCLRSIHPTIRNLNKTLLTLDVSGCSSLKELPTEMGKMEKLTHLLIDETPIREIPMSEGFMAELKILSASSCRELDHLPDSIGSLMNLEKLTLDGCFSLTKLPESIGKLTKLSQLGLGYSKVMKLPDSIGSLLNLDKLTLNGCWSLMKLPESIGKLTKLSQLELGYSKVMELPDSIGSLVNLDKLTLNGCRSLTKLPESIGKLTKLSELELQESRVVELPDSIGDLDNLNELDISDTCIERLPTTIGKLRNLQNLIATSLQRVEVPDEIGELSGLKVLSFDGCGFLSWLPQSIHNLYRLQELNLSGCEKLKMIQGLDSLECLERLVIKGCPLLEKLGNLPRLKTLKKLKLCNCEKLSDFDGIDKLTSLQQLMIEGCSLAMRSLDLSKFKNLSFLMLKQFEIKEIRMPQNLPDNSVFASLVVHIEGCEKVKEIKGLREQKNMKKLKISDCNSLDELLDISLFASLLEVHIEGCGKLKEIKGLREQKNMVKLKISGCNSFDELPDISLFASLEQLHIGGCGKLKKIKGFQEQKNMNKLKISGCNSLDELPDISMFISLIKLQVKGCEKLREVKVLQEQKNLRILDLSCCMSMETLPDFSLCTNLRGLIAKGCEKLTEIKEIPMSLRVLDISGCTSLVNLHFSGCGNLKGLLAGGCSKLTGIMGLEGQVELKILDFSSCKSLKNLPDFSLFTGLVHLRLSGCEKLNEIKGLPRYLQFLDISGCQSLVNLLAFSQCKVLKSLLARGCSSLTKFVWPTDAGCYMHVLDLSDCKSLEVFPYISKSWRLDHLDLSGCEKLNQINGQLPRTLKTLNICGCKRLKSLPNFRKCSWLKEVLAEDCSKLEELKGLENLLELRVLAIHGCESLKRKPHLRNDCIRTDPLEKTIRFEKMRRITNNRWGGMEFKGYITRSSSDVDGSVPQMMLFEDSVHIYSPIEDGGIDLYELNSDEEEEEYDQIL